MLGLCDLSGIECIDSVGRDKKANAVAKLVGKDLEGGLVSNSNDQERDINRDIKPCMRRHKMEEKHISKECE